MNLLLLHPQIADIVGTIAFAMAALGICTVKPSIDGSDDWSYAVREIRMPVFAGAIGGLCLGAGLGMVGTWVPALLLWAAVGAMAVTCAAWGVLDWRSIRKQVDMLSTKWRWALGDTSDQRVVLVAGHWRPGVVEKAMEIVRKTGWLVEMPSGLGIIADHERVIHFTRTEATPSRVSAGV
jgi:hypothetical protein